MINIYYGPSFGHEFRQIWQDIEPLSKSIKEFHQNIGQENLLKCPSFASHIARTYVIKSPFGGAMYRSNEKGRSPHWVARLAEPLDVGTQTFSDEGLSQILSNNFYIFFADKPLTMSVTPPYLHGGKIFGVAGDYDIGRWFRPLSISTLCNATKNSPNVFSRGEALSYVSFDTHEKIKLVPVDWPDEALRYTHSCISYKMLRPMQSLKSIYDFFSQTGWRRRILNLAQQNIIEK